MYYEIRFVNLARGRPSQRHGMFAFLVASVSDHDAVSPCAMPPVVVTLISSGAKPVRDNKTTFRSSHRSDHCVYRSHRSDHCVQITQIRSLDLQITQIRSLHVQITDQITVCTGHRSFSGIYIVCATFHEADRSTGAQRNSVFSSRNCASPF